MNITSLIFKISFFVVLQLYLSVQVFICVYLCVYGGGVVHADIRGLILNKRVIPRCGQEVGGLLCCSMRSAN